MDDDPETNQDFLICTLPSPELASRRAEIQRLMEQSGAISSTSDGVLVTFPNTNEIAHALVDFVRFEQQCCSAITYELRSEPPHADLVLQLRAPTAMVSVVQGFYRTGKKLSIEGVD